MDENTPAPSVEEQLKAIQERLSKAEAENTQLRRDQLNMLMRAPSAPAAQAYSPAPPPAMNVENLPDPAVDKDGYSRAFAQRWQEHQHALREYEQAQRIAEEQNANRDYALVEQFKQKYPGYSVEGAKLVAAKIINEKRAMGWNVDQYAYGMPDQFLQDIAGAYEKEFGRPAAPAAPVTTVTNYSSPEEQLLRTGGILGGNESGGAPTSALTPEVEGPSISDILRAGQVKAGIVR